jgi:hypothetical protein
MNIFKTVINGIGSGLSAAWHAIAHLFAADILPFAIDLAEDYNQAVKSGVPQAVVDVIKGVNANAGKVAQELADEAAVLAPKVLATALGLQALESGTTPEQEVAWAQGLIDAYGSANLVKTSKAWTTLATELAVLYDNGRTTNKTWAQWTDTIEKAFQAIQRAVAAAKAEQADATAS